MRGGAKCLITIDTHYPADCNAHSTLGTLTDAARHTRAASTMSRTRAASSRGMANFPKHRLTDVGLQSTSRHHIGIGTGLASGDGSEHPDAVHMPGRQRRTLTIDGGHGLGESCRTSQSIGSA